MLQYSVLAITIITLHLVRISIKNTFVVTIIIGEAITKNWFKNVVYF